MNVAHNLKNNKLSWLVYLSAIAGFALYSGSAAFAVQDGATKAGRKSETKAEAKKPAIPPEMQKGTPLVSSGEGESELIADGEDAAWEFRPYRVLVWICSDQSSGIEANLNGLSHGILNRAELIDPCGWRLTVERAKGPWRLKFLDSIGESSELEEIADNEYVLGYDKLMVVALNGGPDYFTSRIREFDIQTQQWGPLQRIKFVDIANASNVITQSMARAFMPIARVDRVSEKDEVFTRVRAMKSSVVAKLSDGGEWVVEPNEASPIFVKSSDRFLPIIRRTDRSGNLTKLQSITFTFLSIEEQDEALAKCSIQSYHRAPMANRTSKRAQKLALVIRPPNGETVLRLVSREDQRPMEGVEVWTGVPGGPREDVRMIGKTDWRGEFVVKPDEHGMQMIRLKSGRRGLMKLPIIPGLYNELVAEVPNDDTRLFAEGVIDGMKKEILNLVAQRSIFESDIEEALNKKQPKAAREALNRYRQLPTQEQIKNRLGDEEIRLRGQTKNKRELDYIGNMFQTLRTILNSKIASSKESELMQRIQATRVPAGSSNNGGR